MFSEYKQRAPNSYWNRSGLKTLPREHKFMLTPKEQNTEFQEGETRHKQGMKHEITWLSGCLTCMEP